MPNTKPENPIKRKRRPNSHLPPGIGDRIVVQNVNVPGLTTRVDARKYQAMRDAMLNILPHGEPGLTQEEMLAKILTHLPEDLFPGGERAGWWLKTVRLDLEAKGIVIREDVKPLRWHQR
jgi:hypothetical protein